MSFHSRLECIGDEAVGRIDETEASLCEIGVDLGALDGATAEPIRLVMPRFDLFLISRASSTAAGVI